MEQTVKSSKERLSALNSIWTFLVRVGFIAFSYLMPSLTIFAVISVSGLKPSFNTLSEPDIDKGYFSTVTMWSAIYIITAPLEYFLLLVLCISRQKNKNWWIISVLVERVREARPVALAVSIIGLGIWGVQIVLWMKCPTEFTNCISNFAPNDSSPVPTTQYSELYSFMENVICLEYTSNNISQIFQNTTEPTVTIDTYLELQHECFEITKVCTPVCQDQSSLITFLSAVFTSLMGIIAIVNYNGPYYSGLPHHLKVFDKLKLPELQIEFLDKKGLSKLYKWIPTVWSSSSELIRGLPVIVSLSLSCSDKDYDKEFEYLKIKHSDLPWGWVEGLEREDYKNLRILVPDQQKDVSPAWKITGPFNELYEPLKNLLKCKNLEETSTTYALDVEFSILFKKVEPNQGQEDQKIEAFLLCAKNLRLFGKYIIQLEEKEIRQLMRIEKDSFQLEKINFPKSFDGLKPFNSKQLNKYFPSLIQKMEQEMQQPEQEDKQKLKTIEIEK